MKKFEITENRLKAMAKKCPEAEEILKEGFPEAFEEEWENITLRIKLEEKEDGKEVSAIGARMYPEDYFMPYTVKFVDAWEGDRESGNPATKFAIYKLVNGRIYRKLRNKIRT